MTHSSPILLLLYKGRIQHHKVQQPLLLHPSLNRTKVIWNHCHEITTEMLCVCFPSLFSITFTSKSFFVCFDCPSTSDARACHMVNIAGVLEITKLKKPLPRRKIHLSLKGCVCLWFADASPNRRQQWTLHSSSSSVSYLSAIQHQAIPQQRQGRREIALNILVWSNQWIQPMDSSRSFILNFFIHR